MKKYFVVKHHSDMITPQYKKLLHVLPIYLVMHQLSTIEVFCTEQMNPL